MERYTGRSQGFTPLPHAPGIPFGAPCSSDLTVTSHGALSSRPPSVSVGRRIKGSKDLSNHRVRTLVLAETRLYREGLVNVLDRHPRILVIGAADSAATGLAAVATSHPDAVIIDARLAGEVGTVRALLATHPHARVVAFGVVDSEETIVSCAEAGVAGYVPCEAGLDELVAVVEGAMHDEVVCSPRLAGTLLRRVGALARERGPAGPEVRLTSRETQIIGLIDEGLSNKEIAARLQIGLPTVKNHIHHILEKLGVSRRGEAAARVRSLGHREPDRIL